MLFYDIEAYPQYWCVVVIDDETEMKYVFEDVQSLRDFYKENRHQTWVGYNSRSYDAPMLRFIMLGLDPFQCSQDLIVIGKKWFEFSFDITEKYKRIPLKNFDCMLFGKGLKKLEGFRGSSIIETSIPFDTDRPLTREEKDEIVHYCTHDVLECRKVFYDTKEEYDSHESLVEAFDLEPVHFNKSKAQLAALILGAVKQPRFDEWEFEIPDTLQIEKYQHIVDWYLDYSNHDYKKKLNIDVAGVPHVFAWGGIHGAITSYSGEGVFVNMDVASYYPAMMIEYGYLSRNVQDSNKYRQIRDQRLDFKKQKDPRQLPYKIVLNSTYGAMKDKFNNLYDPRQANSVCVSGQLLLLDLIEHLEDYCQIIQSNTDGVLVKLNNGTEEEYNKVVSIGQEWSKRTRMELEYETVNRVYQKDVNNYLTVDEKGKYKSKGAYVKKLSTVDYDLPIVNEAIVNFLVHAKPIEDTINECDDLIKFQKIVMISRKYKHGLHGDKVLNERHLRVFASTDENDAGIFKVHVIKDNVNKVSDTPVHAFLMNEDVTNKKASDYPLDRQYYINMAKKRIKPFFSK